MVLLIPACKECHAAGEILFLSPDRPVITAFFKQECILCDGEMEYLRAKLIDLEWLSEDDINNLTGSHEGK